MPELPEVETTVRLHRARLEGRRIQAFTTRWRKNALPSPARVRTGLIGRTIVTLTRRGKLIVFALDDGTWLLVHLRMSGRLAWADDPRAARRHVRATWDLAGGEQLLFCDARKFGRITHTTDLAAATATLGPEPLDSGFTARVLAQRLDGRRRALKPLLLDQTVIAGLGNIYTDEALFRAGLHPLRSADSLDGSELRRLHRAIRSTLQQGIRHNGTTIDWVYPTGRMQDHLLVYGRGGKACRRCGAPIETLRVGQRGTHICPCCQPA